MLENNNSALLDNLNLPIYAFHEKCELINILNYTKNNFENDNWNDYEDENNSNSTKLDYFDKFDENSSIISNNDFIDNNKKILYKSEEKESIFDDIFKNKKENVSCSNMENIKTVFTNYSIKLSEKKSVIKLKKININSNENSKEKIINVINKGNNDIVSKKIKKIKNFWNKKQKSLFQIFIFHRNKKILKNKNRLKKVQLLNKKFNIRNK